MGKDALKTKKKTRQDLKRTIMELESQLISSAYFANIALDSMKKRDMAGSGIIISLSYLGGKKVFEPVCICGGLSNDTIDAIKNDLKRSSTYQKELSL